MPWKEASVISLRKEFVELARNGSNISRLCESFGISRQAGYKWIRRYISGGEVALADESRRPVNSPGKVDKRIEEVVLEIRGQHPAWGGRKIKRRMQNLGFREAPAASTITSILRRHGLIEPSQSDKHSAFQRFEREFPNDLWQMDFKGHVACPEGRCHPLTILDDCTRYAVAVKACLNERRETVQSCLEDTFRRYGLPNQIITDNGPPWGNQAINPYTQLTVWLMRLGIVISHSAPVHPQTLGKDERFHRTFKAEILGESLPWRNQEVQKRFDQWRFSYNHYRPHEALNMEVPASRYQTSKRAFPESLPAIEYGSTDIVRKVQQKGIVHFQGREFRIPHAFIGYHIALRQSSQGDGSFELYFVRQLITVINLTDHHSHKSVNYVPEHL
jgi:transposase InsO family protein